MDARLGRHPGAVHGDAAAGSPQVQRGEVFQLGAESGGPQDDVGREEAAIGEPDAVGLYAVNMGCRSSRPASSAARRAGVQIRPVTDDHALGRQPLPHAFFHEGDGVVPGLGVEGGVPPFRFAAGKPAGGGDLRDLVQQPDGGNTPAHHNDVQAAELLGGDVVGHMQLPPRNVERPG